MGSHRKLGIYVGYHSPSIIKYLEPLIARYTDYTFNEDHFMALGGEYKYHSECQKINWDDKFILSSSPRTKETELQIQKIINLQNIATNLLDSFTDYKGVTKYWNPTVNAPERMEVPKKTIHAPFINYTSFREVYDCSTIIINSSFSTIIAESALGDPDPKTRIEYKKC
jgi:hypothetical protein